MRRDSQQLKHFLEAEKKLMSNDEDSDLLKSIESVVGHILTKHKEVPWIASFCKEVQPSTAAQT